MIRILITLTFVLCGYIISTHFLSFSGSNWITETEKHTLVLEIKKEKKTPDKNVPIQQQIADSWYLPLGNDGYNYKTLQNTKYGTTVENTAYNIRNLDLILGANNITCFDVGAHRIYHAGVDLYRTEDTTQGAEVKAIANGIVTDVEYSLWPGGVVLIKHILPDNSELFSLYGHIETSLSVSDTVAIGDTIGYVVGNPHTGRFPEFHPDGDDSHLHFEIRTFQDAATVFPECAGAKAFGPGYTYPNLPDTYGYVDPLTFLSQRITRTITHQVYTPLLFSDKQIPTCIEGQDLAQNGGFEDGPEDDPAPWLQISTKYGTVSDRPLVQDYTVFAGERSARLGGWDVPGQIVDEEMPQSVIIPTNIISIEWRFVMQVFNPVAPDPTDIFNLTMNQAHTGRNIGGGITVFGESGLTGGWYAFQLKIRGMDTLAGQAVSFSHTGLSYNDLASSFLLDEMEIITFCNSSPKQQQKTPSNSIEWTLKVTPLVED